MASCVASPSLAQDAPAPLVFTVGAPDRAASGASTLHVSPAIEERGLTLWSGGAADFGIGVTQSSSKWTLRSIASMTTVPAEGGFRPSLRQIEIIRDIRSTGTWSISGGGGIREEWDGTRTLIGRVLAGSDVAHGRLEGSVVVQRSASSPRSRHDTADVVTTLGWSRPMNDRVSFGVESIGQDLEGLWDPAEADGGAKLLVGPSFQAQSTHRAWTASLTAGPVLRPVALSGGSHFAVFASATWMPSLHR